MREEKPRQRGEREQRRRRATERGAGVHRVLASALGEFTLAEPRGALAPGRTTLNKELFTREVVWSVVASLGLGATLPRVELLRVGSAADYLTSLCLSLLV